MRFFLNGSWASQANFQKSSYILKFVSNIANWNSKNTFQSASFPFVVPRQLELFIFWPQQSWILKNGFSINMIVLNSSFSSSIPFLTRPSLWSRVQGVRWEGKSEEDITFQSRAPTAFRRTSQYQFTGIVRSLCELKTWSWGLRLRLYFNILPRLFNKAAFPD